MGTQKIALKSDRDDIEAIISFIEAAGFPMDHFPPESEDSRECWQFDGELEGLLIIVYPRWCGMFVSCEISYGCDLSREDENLDGRTKDWIKDFGDDFLAAIEGWK